MSGSQQTHVSVSGYINDDIANFNLLFKMAAQIRAAQSDIVFDFNGCKFLAQNAIAFIGGLTMLALNSGLQVYYNLQGLSPRVHHHIEENGFLTAFKIGSNTGLIKDTAVPFRIDRNVDANGFTSYLRDLWLSKARIDLDDPLKDNIVTAVLEAYLNVFDHAASPVGVTSCGQHFPNNKELDITLVDFGVGIPYNVRTFLGQPHMSASQALTWAFQKGNTTKKGKISRGLGLKDLKRFIQRNNGKLEVYSESGYILVDRNGEQLQNHSVAFRGTVVQITLKCDRRHYRLEDVLEQASNDDPLF